jgi:hypothetical protein
MIGLSFLCIFAYKEMPYELYLYSMFCGPLGILFPYIIYAWSCATDHAKTRIIADDCDGFSI